MIARAIDAGLSRLLNPNDWLARHQALCLIALAILICIAGGI